MRRMLFVCGIVLVSFSSCASFHYAVTVGLSPDVEERYGEYISVEVDVGAATADQEMEIKKVGVDDYFNPQTPLRNRVKPQVLRFAEENQDRQRVLLQKVAGKSLFVIANLPPVTGVNIENDGRFLFLPLKKTVFRQKVFVEVASTRITQVNKKKLDQNRAQRLQKRGE